MGDFIEDDGGEYLSEEDVAVGKSKKPKHSNASSFFKGKGRSSVSATTTASALNDSFFQNLVAQIEEPASSASEAEPAMTCSASVNDISFSAAGHSEAAAKLERVLPQLPKATESGLLAMDYGDSEDCARQDDIADWYNEEELSSIESQMQETRILPTVEAKPAPVYALQASTTRPAVSPVDDDCEYFYWFDAYERQPNGPVYLFGKLRDQASPDGVSTCCLILDGLQRNLFFLPRPGADYDAVQAEVSELVQSYGIGKFGCKRVTRKYAFELPSVPAESEYLKLVYPFASSAQLPASLSGSTFSQVFGTNTSALELFLVKRRIMGPCWLRLRGAARSGRSVSWCKVEITVTSAKAISVASAGDSSDPSWAPPPLSALSLSLRTVLNPETRNHELVAVSGMLYPSAEVSGVHDDASGKAKCSAAFTVVRDPSEVGFTAKFTEALNATAKDAASGRAIKIEIVKTEKALLNYLVALWARYDPDLLLGHNFWGFDLGVLLARMRACKVDFWSRVGRLNWSQWPKGKGASLGGTTEASWAERQLVCGRLVCDTYLAAKDLVKAKNYALGTLTESLLGLRRAPFDPECTRSAFDRPEGLSTLLTGSEMDAFYIASLMFQMQVLPLTLQLTQIAGNLWSRTLVGARAERNEFLLLHEFHNLKFICPDKQAHFREQPLAASPEANNEDEAGAPASKSGRRKPQYSGGLVLEPKKGLYDRIVLLLDFNSLYPSIIQEYNICFTTIDRQHGAAAPEDADEEEAMPSVPDSSLPAGVLPRILKTLVERRRAVKSLMKHRDRIAPAQYTAYNVRQQALKLTANSMYGCLGFAHSRFYAKPLAMLITAKGREILQSTVNLTREVCQLDVIYGDTDSIMVNTRSSSLAEARLLGAKIKKAVNERYRLLEIELDGIFQRLLLLKKKKYAALVVEEERADGTFATKLETKGLDLVRRDWCELSVDASAFILDVVMRGENGDLVVEAIHDSLRRVAAELQAGSVPLEKFVISKNLTKDPTAYADAKSQPHVAVALRMRQRGLTAASGDTIPYVICQQGSGAGQETGHSGLAEHARHPDEVRKDPTLKIDHVWYLQTQLHPPIARLCEHIEGTDSGRLAACLGLDPRKFRSSGSEGHAAHSGDLIGSFKFSSMISDEERFAHLDKLSVTCRLCRHSFQFVGVVAEDCGSKDSAIRVALSCPSCQNRLSIPALHHAVQLSFRSAVDKYYAYWMRCDEVDCGAETQRIGVYDRRCPQDGCKGVLRPVLAPSHVYTHLQYLQSLFATDRISQRLASKLSVADSRLIQQIALEVDPIRTFVDAQLRHCAYPVIDFRQLFSFLSK